MTNIVYFFRRLNGTQSFLVTFRASTTDSRGRLLEESMDEHNFVALNTGAGTYVRRTGVVSHLDISMANINIARIANWSVLNDTRQRSSTRHH